MCCAMPKSNSNVLDYAIEQGAEAIATGHYARKDVRDGIHHLLRGVDGNKDQSYFLYRLQPHQLEKALFPLGDLEKPEVRRLAEQFRLPTATKKKTAQAFVLLANALSANFCKIPAHPRRQYAHPEGKIGQTFGLDLYTIGQRKGLGIGGRANLGLW